MLTDNNRANATIESTGLLDKEEHRVCQRPGSGSLDETGLMTSETRKPTCTLNTNHKRLVGEKITWYSTKIFCAHVLPLFKKFKIETKLKCVLKLKGKLLVC